MFKKFTTSLSKAPLTIFFIKDPWYKVLLYVIFVTFLIALPGFTKVIINPEMNYDMYQYLKQSLKEDFVLENTTIVNGTLSYEGSTTITVDYISVSIGERSTDAYQIQIHFETNDLVIYAMNTEIDRMDYQALNLENFDFSNTDTISLTRLSVAVKTLFEHQATLLWAEAFALYFLAIGDYLLVTFIMAMLMSIMFQRVPMQFRLRIKLSFYVMTVYAVIQMILALFDIYDMNIIALIVAYGYHIWVYRSIKVIPKGAHLDG